MKEIHRGLAELSEFIGPASAAAAIGVLGAMIIIVWGRA